MPFNPFNKPPTGPNGIPIPPHSLFDENPFDPSEGIDFGDVKKLNDEYDKMPREYLGVLMNYETRVFFEGLVRQLGQQTVESLLKSEKADFNHGDLISLNCNGLVKLTSIDSLPNTVQNLETADCKNLRLITKLPSSLDEYYCEDAGFTHNKPYFDSLKKSYPQVHFITSF